MKHVTSLIVGALLASIFVVAPVASPTSAAERQVALGVSVYDDQNPAEIDAYIQNAGRTPAIWAVWGDWGGPDRQFPTSFMNTLASRSITPMVNWQPVNPADPYDCSNWSLATIIGGKYDAYIRDWALAAKDFGHDVLLRFAHEMNGNWFVWGRGLCNNTPKKFKKAWRHVWNIFHQVGASNVKFVWSPYGTYRLSYYYPGNTYVDYSGITAFNWGPSDKYNPQPWRSMKAVFRPLVRATLGVTNKPIIAAEMGSAYEPNCASCDKAAWIRDGYPAVYARWPAVVAFVYFDIDLSKIAQQPDWRLNSPPAALTAYRNIVQDIRFQGSL